MPGQTYGVSEHNFGIPGFHHDTLLSFDWRQVRRHLFHLVEEDELRLGASWLRMQLQSVRIQFGVASLPGRRKRATQFFNVAVEYAIRLCKVIKLVLLILMFTKLYNDEMRRFKDCNKFNADKTKKINSKIAVLKL